MEEIASNKEGSHKYFESAVRNRQQRVVVQPFIDDQYRSLMLQYVTKQKTDATYGTKNVRSHYEQASSYATISYQHCGAC